MRSRLNPNEVQHERVYMSGRRKAQGVVVTKIVGKSVGKVTFAMS